MLREYLFSICTFSATLSVCLLLFLPNILMNLNDIQDQLKHRPRITPVDKNQTNPLDGCLHVYLDMGSHTGVQLRKLFEPQRFPNSKVLPVFSKYFGPPSTRNPKVCAVGFEPNPAFEAGLKELERKYNECGWKVKIFTRTGVQAGGQKKKFSVPGSNLGGRLIPETDNKGSDVNLVRIATYILEVVARRQLPRGIEMLEVPKVVMKLDVEGLELEIMPDLLLTGALAHVDRLMVDWHYLEIHRDRANIEEVQKLKDSIFLIQNLTRKYALEDEVTSLDDLDDETYGSYREIPVTCQL